MTTSLNELANASGRGEGFCSHCDERVEDAHVKDGERELHLTCEQRTLMNFGEAYLQGLIEVEG